MKQSSKQSTTRRNNHEGTIFQVETKSGISWHSRTTFIDPKTGKPVTIKRAGKTKIEAVSQMKKARDNCLNGFTKEKESITLNEWLNKWLNSYICHRVRIRTFELYQATINQYVVGSFGDMLLKNVTTDFIQQNLSDLQNFGGKKKQGLSPHTITNLRRYLITSLDVAVKQKYIEENPARGTSKPRTEQKQIQTLCEGEILQILKAAKEESYYAHAIFSIALSTGMRLGEVFGLQWKDFNFSSNTVTINQAQTSTKKLGKILQSPKTKLSRRTLFLDPVVIQILIQHKEQQDLQRRELGNLYENNDLVFPNAFGKLCDTDNFTKRIMKRVLKKTGITRHITFHDFRHTHATLLIEKNVPLKSIQSQLGHASITTTMNVYGHLTPALQNMPVEVLKGLWD